jgi:ribonuclease BN (tRNA processing enzyme)
MTQAAHDLVDGVDVLLHDAQFLESERRLADDYGHATVEETISLAEKAGVGSLVLFHHSPVRTDDELDRILDPLDHDIPVVVGREGMRLRVGATEGRPA